MSTPKNILVATDFGEASSDALRYAFGLAAGGDAKVHLVHVVTVQAMRDAASPTHEPLEDADAGALRTLTKLVEPYLSSGNVGELNAPVGDPAALILQTAEELSADMLVIGAHHSRPLGRTTTAGRVFRRAECPVVVLRGSRQTRTHAA